MDCKYFIRNRGFDVLKIFDICNNIWFFAFSFCSGINIDVSGQNLIAAAKVEAHNRCRCFPLINSFAQSSMAQCVIL